MEIRSHKDIASGAREASINCRYCREPLPAGEATQPGGACRLCAEEVAQFGWRTVYDREAKLGRIPENLRVAYKL